MSHDAFCPQSEPDETSPCHCDGIINARADSDHRHEDIRSEIIALMERLYAVFTPEQAAMVGLGELVPQRYFSARRSDGRASQRCPVRYRGVRCGGLPLTL